MSAKAPQFTQTELKQAKAFLDEKRIRAFLFSDGTYQIELYDPKTKTSFSPFFHITDAGKILDCFCTCKAAEKKKSCAHLAAAYQLIFRGHAEPLHVRFRTSLWNQLSLIGSQRHGYESQILKAEDKGFAAHSATGKKLFYITAANEKSRKQLEKLFFQRPVETEETSLKFSNLPHSELSLWKQGRPSPKLRYELSFWADLAKWWMLLQDAEVPYTIEFSYDHDPLPKWIVVNFKDFSFGFYIAEVNWPKIIPALTTVKSPLTVSELSYRVLGKMSYDPQKREMHLEFKGQKEEADKEETMGGGVQVGEWLFMPQRGFFPGRLDPLLNEKVIPAQRMQALLQKHAKLVKKYLVGTPLELEEVNVQYALHIDQRQTLHIVSYVFEPGDLQKPTSAYFGPWVYVERKGFFHLQNLFFDGVEKIVSKPLVGDFVSRHRHWLAAFDGFQTHPSSLESHLTYALSPDETLRFETRVEFAEEPGEIVDFGEWIYVKGRGFYAKRTGRTGVKLRAGLRVLAHEISTFINAHIEELEQLPRFFSDDTPIEKSGLKLSFNENGRILVQPESIFKAGYTPEQVLFFGDYTYVQGEGFAEIPPECRLPDVYQRDRVIDEASEPYFISYELDLLAPFIITSDPRLKKPKTLALHILQIKRDTRSKGPAQWLVDFVYESDVGTTSVFEIWQGLNENKRYVFTSAGLIFLRQMRFAWLKNLPKKRWLKGGERLKLSTLEWLKLSVSEEIQDPKGTSKEAKASRQVLEEFRSFQTDELVNFDGFQSRLRPYQEIGVRWLWFLYTHGLSGMLCDEMGLGKTHQAMGLLASVYNAQLKEDEADKKKYIVVCPTSVIYHWEDLLKRFLPQFRVSVYHGLGRKIRRRLRHSFDLLWNAAQREKTTG